MVDARGAPCQNFQSVISAPEQARGEVDRLDERADVFGLGAILCAILTGRPPFVGPSSIECLRQAANGDLGETPARLDQCGTDTELVQLTKTCLAVDPDLRPRHAGVVAAKLEAYEAGVQDRLRRAEVERAQAEVQVAEERKRLVLERQKRRVTVAMGLLGLVLVLGGGVVALWYVRDQAARQERYQQLEHDLAEQLAQFQKQQDDLQGKMKDPLAAAALLSDIDGWKNDLDRMRQTWKRAETIFKADEELLGENFSVSLADQERFIIEAQETWKTAKQLDDIRLDASTLVDGNWIPAYAIENYPKVFSELGLNVEQDSAPQLAERIQRSGNRQALVAALDHWASLLKMDNPLLPRLLEIARLADPDLWADQVRDQGNADSKTRLLKLAGEAPAGRATPQLLLLLAWKLGAHDKKAAATLARQAVLAQPRDFWLHFDLGNLVKDPTERAGCFQSALILRPKNAAAYNNLGWALRDKKDLDRAIQCYRKAVELAPAFAMAHNNLGSALFTKKDLEGAIRSYNEALALNPKLIQALNGLGAVLKSRGDSDSALKLYLKALALNPHFGPTHNNLGRVMFERKFVSAALEHYYKSIDLDPGSPITQNNLGLALQFGRKDLDGAMKAYRQALVLDPDYAPAHYNIGTVLKARGDVKGAMQCYRRAIQCDPNLVQAHNNLGNLLQEQGDLEEAARHYQMAVQLEPRYALAHVNLGLTLQEQGEFEKALAELQLGHAVGSKQAGWRVPSESLVKQCAKLAALDKKRAAILKGEVKARDATEQLALARLCKVKKLFVQAVGFYQSAFAADSNQDHTQNQFEAACAAALAASEKGEDASRQRRQALAWLRKALSRLKEQLQTDPKNCTEIANQLRHWQNEKCLASVRGPKALAALSPAEQQEWQRLWTEVAALVQKIQQ